MFEDQDVLLNAQNLRSKVLELEDVCVRSLPLITSASDQDITEVTSINNTHTSNWYNLTFDVWYFIVSIDHLSLFVRLDYLFLWYHLPTSFASLLFSSLHFSSLLFTYDCMIRLTSDTSITAKNKDVKSIRYSSQLIHTTHTPSLRASCSSPLLLVTPLTRLPSLLVAPLLLHQWNPVFSFFYLILPFSLFTLLFTHRHFTHAFCTATTPSWPQSYINSFNLVSLLFTISLSLISSSPLSLFPSLSQSLSLLHAFHRSLLLD